MNYEDIHLLGVRIHKVTVEQLLNQIIIYALDPRKRIIVNVNIKAMNLAWDLEWYKDFLNSADLVFCDGMGVVYGANLSGYSMVVRHRMTCPDWLESLSLLCEQNAVSLFLLGGSPGIAWSAREKLLSIAPDLRVTAHHGYFDKSGSENLRVLDMIRDFKTDILYVGMGMPLQERWIIDNFERIEASVIMPLGACLDFYVGERSRARRWFTDYGFEWLSRLVTEPKRLWRRYLIGNPLFFWRILREHIRRYID